VIVAMMNRVPSDLQNIAKAVRSSSGGVVALFSGDAGTGKTEAASVVASLLEAPLLRVDLQALFSKYIGETEKNLDRMFEAAETAGAVLFFDEADALFAKRSEVKDAHDRYANSQADHLLQRLERFRGIVILATNESDDVETTFLKRIPHVLEFRVRRKD
jgi:SpoVK/Ycf46/Vps4 family AAA+-type ATPase